MANLSLEILSLYNLAQVTLDNGTRLEAGEPGIWKIFTEETDYDLLAEVWKKWRDATGRKFRGRFEERVNLLNKGARENGEKHSVQAWFPLKIAAAILPLPRLSDVAFACPSIAKNELK